jgi:hypothetical protein
MQLSRASTFGCLREAHSIQAAGAFWKSSALLKFKITDSILCPDHSTET